MEYLKSTVMVIEGDEEYRKMYRRVIAEDLKAKYREAVTPFKLLSICAVIHLLM